MNDRHEIPTAIPMFSGSPSSKKSTSTFADVDRYRKRQNGSSFFGSPTWDRNEYLCACFRQLKTVLYYWATVAMQQLLPSLFIAALVADICLRFRAVWTAHKSAAFITRWGQFLFFAATAKEASASLTVSWNDTFGCFVAHQRTHTLHCSSDWRVTENMRDGRSLL
jgi:hypothetical protein